VADIRVKVRVQVGPDIIEVERVIGNPNRYSSDGPDMSIVDEQMREMFERALPLVLVPRERDS
jgi:hypothetical protein